MNLGVGVEEEEEVEELESFFFNREEEREEGRAEVEKGTEGVRLCK